MKKPELISPAGTLEKLKIAFEFGADAVYAGVPDFSMRARINGFTYGKMAKGVEYAHKRGKKVYATLNIYAHNKHLKKAETAIRKYADMGVDALIVSDPGFLNISRKIAPRMVLHLSTQANCLNFEAAKFWMGQGFKRIVLAREASLEEIVEIHKRVPKMELECFVHGAMCMSYSGRCILSKWLSGRSANLGECSQPCRWEYEYPPFPPLSKGGIKGQSLFIREGKQENRTEMSIEEDRHGTYIFNSRDLCLIEHLDKLYKAGVTSFKIEGRTKSAYYVAATAKLYREGIDKIPLTPFKKGGKLMYMPPKGWKEEVQKITNRGYTTGFLFGEKKCEHNFARSHEECDWQFAGEAAGEGIYLEERDRRKHGGKKGVMPVEKSPLTPLWKRGGYLAAIKVHNALYVGDEIEIVVPRGENIRMVIGEMHDMKAGKEIKEAHGGQGQTVIIFSDADIPARSMVRRKIC